MMSAFFIACKNILHSMNNSNKIYQFINYPIYRLSSFYLRNAVKGIGTGAEVMEFDSQLGQIG